LYDIRSGNGAGQFLQPRSPHWASESKSL